MNICEKRVQDDVSRLKKSTSQAIECFCEQMSAITFQFFTSSNFGFWRSTKYIFFPEPFVRVWTLVEINSGARSSSSVPAIKFFCSELKSNIFFNYFGNKLPFYTHKIMNTKVSVLSSKFFVGPRSIKLKVIKKPRISYQLFLFQNAFKKFSAVSFKFEMSFYINCLK